MKTREEAKRKAWQLILAMEVRNLSDTFDVAMAMYDWLNTQPDANTEPLIHNRSFEDEVRDQLGHRLNNTPPTAVPNESYRLPYSPGNKKITLKLKTDAEN
jgi:hypothetical protein